MSIVIGVAVGFIAYEQRKTHRINKIFNFKKELRRIREAKT